MTTQTRELPHDPYIRAVVIALTANGLEPEGWWTSDAETDPYRTDDDGATMLNAVLSWSGDHTAIADTVAPAGMLLLWDHPAEQWQYAERRAEGGNEEPKFLPKLGRYSAPDAVAATVRALLAGEPLPEGHAPYWHPADSVRRAITTWEASEESTPDTDRTQPCGEGHCRCYGTGTEHADCACGCDCPRDDDGQLIDD